MMLKRLCAALMAVGTTAALLSTLPESRAAGTSVGAGPSVSAAALAPELLICDNTRRDPAQGRYAAVRIPEGASCYLQGAVVFGNVKALHGARNVSIVNTRVDRNIHLRKVRFDVKIGTRNCRRDPFVGNNIKVTRSHNVAICEMSVQQNIQVTLNDGRITLRDNRAGENIRVVDNLAYDRKPGDGHHDQINAIRLFDNTAGQLIVVRRNAGRPLLLFSNSPTPLT